LSIVLIIITLPVFILSSVLAQSVTNENISSQIYFEDFEALTDHRFLITQLSGEILAQIYNAKERRIEKDLIRSGRGPFELEFIGGMAFNRETKKLYAADLQNGKIICFDHLGNPVKEKNLKITYPQKVDAFGDELLVTTIAMIGKGMPNRSRYPIAYLIDPNTLEVSDTLFFDLNDLNLDRIKDLEKSTTFRLTPLVVSSFKKGLYLVVFESFNKVFLINKNSKLVDEIKVNVNNVEIPEVVKHPSFGYGQRTFSVLNDYARSEESVYFSFGQTSEQTYNGLIKVMISDINTLSVQKHLLKTELELTDPFNSFKVTSDDSTIYGADGIDIIPLSFD
ncbi:MAG: hypothetical protein WD512_04225, partial [Candidatus Paceibacterota bacterium]